MTKLAFKYTHFDLKEQRAGTVVEITLAAVANVRLLSGQNLALYKEAMKHTFVGGVARKSPVRLTIPQGGHWHLVVDMEGHHGEPAPSIRIVEAAAQQPRFKSAS